MDKTAKSSYSCVQDSSHTNKFCSEFNYKSILGQVTENLKSDFHSLSAKYPESNRKDFFSYIIGSVVNVVEFALVDLSKNIASSFNSLNSEVQRLQQKQETIQQQQPPIINQQPLRHHRHDSDRISRTNDYLKSLVTENGQKICSYCFRIGHIRRSCRTKQRAEGKITSPTKRQQHPQFYKDDKSQNQWQHHTKAKEREFQPLASFQPPQPQSAVSSNKPPTSFQLPGQQLADTSQNPILNMLRNQKSQIRLPSDENMVSNLGSGQAENGIQYTVPSKSSKHHSRIFNVPVAMPRKNHSKGYSTLQNVQPILPTGDSNSSLKHQKQNPQNDSDSGLSSYIYHYQNR